MTDKAIEKIFCNACKQETKHFVQARYKKVDDNYITETQHLLIVECCGCEHLAMVKREGLSLDGNPDDILWGVEEIYPPVIYRSPPPWFEDLPDETLRKVLAEIYKSLQTDSHYLATFGSRTLIDRLIVLTVGDKGNFQKGLQALEKADKLSSHKRKCIDPVVDAGNAAAHRGWEPSQEQLKVILDTVEGLIHRLLVLPQLTDELDEAVPSRNDSKKPKVAKKITTVQDKIDVAPKQLRAVYDELTSVIKDFGKDVTIHPRKHYIAFRRKRNFASVIIYNRKRLIRVYLNIDPDSIELDSDRMRDVRQIGHYEAGDLEITIQSEKDIGQLSEFIRASYAAS